MQLSWVPASMDYEEFETISKKPHDLLEDLRSNIRQYSSGEVQLTIYKFPGIISMVVDQMRTLAKENLTGRIGINPTIICLITRGLDILSKDSLVITLIDMKKHLDTLSMSASSQDLDFVLQVYKVLKKFEPSVTIDTFESQGLFVRKALKERIFAAKADLGLSFDTISTITICLALLDSQSWLNPNLADRFHTIISNFKRSLEVRQTLINVLYNYTKQLNGGKVS